MFRVGREIAGAAFARADEVLDYIVAGFWFGLLRRGDVDVKRAAEDFTWGELLEIGVFPHFSPFGLGHAEGSGVGLHGFKQRAGRLKARCQ